MKTKNTIFSLVLLFALFLAACSPQAASTDVMPADTMEEKDEAMMSDQDDEMMAEKDEEMMGDEADEAMMEDKEDGEAMSGKDDEMMSDKDDEMMSDKEGEMAEHEDDAMKDEKDDEMMGDEDDEAMKDDEMAEDAMTSDQDDQMSPDWFKATLADARTGETFTVADFKGKVVLVETLAMWCSNCLKQQGQVLTLHELIGERDDFVSLGIDIDPNENAAALSSYIDKNGFDWLYTVAPPEVAREIAQLYGDQYLNPPSTPMLIIDRQGEVHLLPFGIKSAESLLEALQPFLDAEM